MDEMNEAVHDNQENWDDRAEVHIDSGAYGDLDEFVADRKRFRAW
ncbi:hypothetical protein [Bifidobacterium bombi]|uniref:Uncharacterized protein n=1 Tax=Bifidobacterium bombi DSM 19703 TaxID=1341695 RepID=A0A080N2F7_9BIFI|nr:hypothetical protein [Bifidobacterium bombi]KFF31163.1 hypothetical protein BBOMB_0496 [Bifidobacterium bombi DSM 19703]